MHIKVWGRIHTETLLVISRLMELQFILFCFLFEYLYFPILLQSLCNILVFTEGEKKKAKQPVLLVLLVLLILFLCRWPSWKILCVPDIWANKDYKRIFSPPPTKPPPMLVWSYFYFCQVPSPSHSVLLILCQINRSRVRWICWLYGRPPEKAFCR